jgi:hypothetical protein
VRYAALKVCVVMPLRLRTRLPKWDALHGPAPSISRRLQRGPSPNDINASESGDTISNGSTLWFMFAYVGFERLANGVQVRQLHVAHRVNSCVQTFKVIHSHVAAPSLLLAFKPSRR